MALMITCGSCSGLTPDGASLTCLHCDAALKMPPRWARKLAWVFGPAGAVLLAACYGPSGRYRQGPSMASERGAPMMIDRDRDGSFTKTCENAPQYDRERCEQQLASEPAGANLDCDDTDAARYPGAQDADGDGVDQNCDGIDGWAEPAVVAQPVNAADGT